MKASRHLSSSLSLVIERYLILKQSLGYQFAQGQDVLFSLDKYLAETHSEDLTSEAFLGWCKTLTALTPRVRRKRMSIVRHFSLYRRRSHPHCWVPDPALFPNPQQPVRPYIFSEPDIARLMNSSARLRRTSISPLRPEVFRLSVVLLYSIGLRLGELLRLTIGDYDRHEQTLLIQITKFHKSRILPLPDDVAGELECYLEARRVGQCAVTPETPLIGSRHGSRRYTGQGVRHALNTLFKDSKVYKPNGRFPRIHDFRHSFAVNALLRWYRAGVDVQSRLPLLAAYMGHISISSTVYYLHFIEPLRTLASARFAEHYGSLIASEEIPERSGA